jgi:hypothetical protein
MLYAEIVIKCGINKFIVTPMHSQTACPMSLQLRLIVVVAGQYAWSNLLWCVHIPIKINAITPSSSISAYSQKTACSSLKLKLRNFLKTTHKLILM